MAVGGRFPGTRTGGARSLLGRREAASVFENARDYSRALYRKDDEGVVLRTYDGLEVAIRQNLWGAEIVREIFFEQPYTRHLRLPRDPVVVDVGGYIGDFALYAAKYLGAERVVAYEPTHENFAMLERNIALNGYGNRITAVSKAVGDSDEIVLNVEKLDGDEATCRRTGMRRPSSGPFRASRWRRSSTRTVSTPARLRPTTWARTDGSVRTGCRGSAGDPRARPLPR